MKRQLIRKAHDLLDQCNGCEKKYSSQKNNNHICNECDVFKELREIGDRLSRKSREASKAEFLTVERYKEFKRKVWSDQKIADYFNMCLFELKEWKDSKPELKPIYKKGTKVTLSNEKSVHYFNSMQECAYFLNVVPSTLNKHRQGKGNVFSYKGYKLEVSS